MKKMVYLLPLLFSLACSNTNVQEELEQAYKDLAAARATNEYLKAQMEPEGELVHVVFFKLKTDNDPASHIAAIKKLEAIEVVNDLQVGSFKDLDDARALSTYDLMMEMSFATVEDYQTYQAHPIHLALKEMAKSVLAAPPATYDYLKR
ncbi:MAG: Dabb family protein [Bacteroidota bacterium]